MKSGLDYFLDQVRSLVKTKPPYNAAFTTQALYLLNQAVTIIEGLGEINRKQKIEIEKLKNEVEELRPKRIPTDHDRNASMTEDYQSGMTVKAIAKKNGISEGRVSQILLRLGVRNAGTPRVKGLSKSGNSERQGSSQEGHQEGYSSDADRIGQDGDGGGSHRVGSGEGASGDIYRPRDQLDHADDRELPA